MRRVLISLFIVSCMTGCLFACCGNSGWKTEIEGWETLNGERRTADGVTTFVFPNFQYDELEVKSILHVEMCDTIDSIRVYISNRLSNYLSVRTNGSKLCIGMETKRSISTDEKTVRKVLIPYNLKLKKIALSGTAQFHTDLPLRAKVFNIEMSGASRLVADYIQASEIEANLSGGSVCKCDLRSNQIETNLSGATVYKGNFQCKELEANLSGSSEMKGHISTEQLDLTLSGASKMELEGTANVVEMMLSGCPDLDGYRLNTKRVEGMMSGSSEAELQCSERIAVNLTGTSKLTYEGTAENHCEASRTAKVKHR